MKKILSLVLVALMLASALCLAGCGGKDDNTLLVYTEAGFAPYEFIYNNEIVGHSSGDSLHECKPNCLR